MIPDDLMRPITWILIMLAIHAGVRAWLWTRVDSAAYPPPNIRRWVRSFYLAGIPIIALALRVVPSVDHMGLGVPARPVVTVGVGLIIGLVVAGLASAWQRDWIVTGKRGRLLGRLQIGRIDRGTILKESRRALELELHWAFFRAAVLDTGFSSGVSSGVGAAMWLAIVLLGIEAWSDPATRAALAAPASARSIARSGALAIASTLCFALTGSSAAGLIAQLLARFVLAESSTHDFDPSTVDDPIPSAHEPIIVGS